MRVEVKVKCVPEGNQVMQIRTLACELASKSHSETYNPLADSMFNELLESIVQQAFDAGRNYERKAT